MSKKLEGKVAIVTGAASGIGHAIAIHLGKDGANIVVNDINLQNANEVVDEIVGLDTKAIAIKANVTKSAEVNQMVKATMDHFDQIDILVNNVGTGAPRTPFHESTEEDWDFLIDSDLKSVFNCSRAVIEHMIERRRGRIVNIASVCGMIGCPVHIAYSAAKAGVICFTKVLAKEVGPLGINVNCVSPGPIETPLLLEMPDYIKEIKKHMYISRLGKPEEIGDMVAYLVSDEASFITGQNIAVDGGRTLGW